MILLYSRAASSASFRVRMALGIKKLKWEAMLLNSEEQHGPKYLQLNPQGLVPFLVDGNAKMAQTLAIMEYLGETAGLSFTSRSAQKREGALVILICLQMRRILRPRPCFLGT